MQVNTQQFRRIRRHGDAGFLEYLADCRLHDVPVLCFYVAARLKPAT